MVDLVVLVPEQREGRHRDDQNAPGPQHRHHRLDRPSVVVEMLQHVQSGDQVEPPGGVLIHRISQGFRGDPTSVRSDRVKQALVDLDPPNLSELPQGVEREAVAAADVEDLDRHQGKRPGRRVVPEGSPLGPATTSVRGRAGRNQRHSPVASVAVGSGQADFDGRSRSGATTVKETIASSASTGDRPISSRSIEVGRPRTSSQIRATYSPTIPRQSNCTPAKNQMETIRLANPVGKRSGMANDQATYPIATATAIAERTKPTNWITRIGRLVNEKRPSKASPNSFRNVYFGSPASRAARSKGTPTCVKPTQARSPRRKRRRSGNSSIASSTGRLMQQKSPASSGISIVETNRKSR